MTKHHFALKEVFSFGYNKFIQHAWFVFLTFIIMSSVIGSSIYNPGLNLIVSLMAALSIVSISLMIVRNHSFSFNDLFTPLLSYRRVLRFFALVSFYIIPVLLVGLTSAILVFGAERGSASVTIFGLIFASLFFVINVFIAVRFKFFPYVVVDHEHSSVRDLLRMSYKLTENNFWLVFRFILAAVVFNMLGCLAFGVGLVITVPTTVLASAHLYDKFKSHQV